ncbi:hypothetical protein FF38_10923 [Lucilia cuprina]|uniref:Uncharacterized protein n=1 Tax=Lucilia cuprina TaxID=7375 RepID=A0A0L0C3Q8_LUCCU|nr:hypothetical protein FF38_10923 [Lucilia cuprina]
MNDEDKSLLLLAFSNAVLLLLPILLKILLTPPPPLLAPTTKPPTRGEEEELLLLTAPVTLATAAAAIAAAAAAAELKFKAALSAAVAVRREEAAAAEAVKGSGAVEETIESISFVQVEFAEASNLCAVDDDAVVNERIAVAAAAGDGETVEELDDATDVSLRLSVVEYKSSLGCREECDVVCCCCTSIGMGDVGDCLIIVVVVLLPAKYLVLFTTVSLDSFLSIITSPRSSISILLANLLLFSPTTPLLRSSRPVLRLLLLTVPLLVLLNSLSAAVVVDSCYWPMLGVHAIPLLTDKCDAWHHYFVLQLQRHTLCRLLQIILTISSRLISINAENSNNLNLCVAIALPSHGSCAGGSPASISPDTAVDGLPAGYGCCANGFIL